MENNIEGLRSILFDTIREVKRGEIDLDKAKAIENLSQTIINSAKLEVDLMRVTDTTISTSFLQGTNPKEEPVTYLHKTGGQKLGVK
ncbi:hypothetical protein [Nitrosomonas sp.]|uniref:hypothetical protein n=1 Tax=Nitrosomonas sp. TaxID=42353 RepID=UPI0037C85BD8